MWPSGPNGTFDPLRPAAKVSFSAAGKCPHKIFPRACACVCVVTRHAPQRGSLAVSSTASLRQPRRASPGPQRLDHRTDDVAQHVQQPRAVAATSASSPLPHRFLSELSPGLRWPLRRPFPRPRLTVPGSRPTRSPAVQPPFPAARVAVLKTVPRVQGHRFEKRFETLSGAILRLSATLLRFCGLYGGVWGSYRGVFRRAAVAALAHLLHLDAWPARRALSR